MVPFTFVRFIFFVVCLVAFSSIVSAQETYTDEELDAMSDEDLELICLVRGFELVKDHVNEETGEVYTIQHGDYIEAAKQCLSIENEMNAILEEHPELREELEEEIIKMQKEQEARKEELENLKQQLEGDEAEAEVSNSASEGTAFVGKPTAGASDSTSEGAAFVGKPKVEEAKQETAEGSAISEVEEQQAIGTQTFEEEVEEESATTETKVEADSGTQSTADKTEGLEISDEERIPLNEKEEAALAEQEEVPDDLSLESFIKYVKKDIERVTRILIPILKPMLNAGDLAIRYIRAALSTLRDAYNNNSQTSQTNPTEEMEKA